MRAVRSSPVTKPAESAATFAAVTAGGVCLLALVVLVGWVLGIDALKRVVAGLSTMKVNTALGLLACGLVVIRERGRGRGDLTLDTPSRILAGLTGGVALATLAEYAFGIDLGLDQLLIRDPEVGPGSLPGRMSVLTATSFLLFVTAAAIPRRRSRPWEVAFTFIAGTGFFLGFVVSIGYVYRVRFLFQPKPVTSMAIHTAVAFVALFAALVATRPEHGWTALLLRRNGIGAMARTLVPTFLLLPIAIGWLALQGQIAGLYAAPTVAALLVLMSSLIFTAVLSITALRATALEAAQREREAILTSVLETSLDGFVLIDEEGRIREWNGAAAAIFGWTAAEAIGSRAVDRMPALGEGLQATSGRRPDEESGPVVRRHKEVASRRRDGTPFPAELAVLRVEVGDRELRSVFVRDLTRQRALEDQLRQAQKMEAVGQLTGGIAHDFNNLLTIIILNLDMLESPAEAAVREGIAEAAKAAQRGAVLVRRLLAFSRRQALKPEALDVNALVEDTHHLLQRTLGETVALELHKRADLWRVSIDRAQLESALINLAVNARDAMSGGGRLEIETANAVLSEGDPPHDPEATPGDYVQITVRDTGSGMAPSVLEHAFEPFFTTKEAGRGSGLGLSMVYGFIKQSGGHVRIESDVGRGTTVHLYLPRLRDEQPLERQTVEAIESLHGRGEAILVVEDETAVRGFVVDALEALGYRVFAAGDARSAETVLDDAPHLDLVFTDVVLPGGVTGRQLAERIRERHAQVKVLYTSGYTPNVIVHHGALDAGIHFLGKPYTRQELASSVRRALDG